MSFGSVACKIVGADVGLRLDNFSGEIAPLETAHENFA
jgi:hypothetical protein